MCSNLIIVGDAVTGIKDESIAEIIIPEGVTRIESRAFIECRYLKNIVFPSSLKAIEEEAFAGCIKLENLMLNEGLVIIESWAFSECENIRLISLPNSLEEVGTGVFQGCKKIQFIDCKQNRIFSFVSGCLIKNGYEIIEGFGNRIPEKMQITHIATEAFRNCKYSHLVIPGNIKHIEAFAFEYCEFEKLTINHNVCIEANAFYNCEEIIEINISSDCNIEKGAIEIPDNNMLNVYVDSISIPSKIMECVNIRKYLPDCTWVDSDIKSGTHFIYNSEDVIKKSEMTIPKNGFIESGTFCDLYFIGYGYKQDSTLKVTIAFISNDKLNIKNINDDIIIERKVELVKAVVDGVDYSQEIVDSLFATDGVIQPFELNESMTFSLNSNKLTNALKKSNKITLNFEIDDYEYENEEDYEENDYIQYRCVEKFEFEVLLNN